MTEIDDGGTAYSNGETILSSLFKMYSILFYILAVSVSPFPAGHYVFEFPEAANRFGAVFPFLFFSFLDERL